MTKDEILAAVSARCDKNRAHGWTLEHDLESHQDGFLLDLALAPLLRTFAHNMTIADKISFDQWNKWMTEDHATNLVRAIALLVQELERITERPT